MARSSESKTEEAGGRVAIWYDATTAPLAQALAERSKHAGVLAGSPDPTAPALAGSAEPIARDLRALVDNSPARAIVLLSDRIDSSTRVFEERSALETRSRDTPVIASLEPPPAEAWDRVDFLAPHRDTPSYRSLREAIGDEDAARTMVAIVSRPAGTGSARAVLFDALLGAHDLMGPPERVDAARLTEPDSPRAELVVHMRFADDRAAVIHASASAPAFRRELTITTRSGAALRVDDAGLDWVDAQGRLIERGAKGENAVVEDVFADWLTRRLDRRLTPPEPVDASTLHATGEAVMLSARTGEPERPAALTARIGV